MLLGAQGKQEGMVGGQRRDAKKEGTKSAWWLTACLCLYMANQPHSEVGQSTHLCVVLVGQWFGEEGCTHWLALP